MTLPFTSVRELGYFSFERDRLENLEIREAGSEGFHYFVDGGTGARVNGFVL